MRERDRIERVAVEACLAGGRRLRERFQSGTTSVDRTEHDVKSSADRAAEDAMLGAIFEAFPDHEVYAEESGHHSGEADWRWVVDPLDGTNNFESGLPNFGSAVAVESGETELAALYAPVTEDLYVARRGDGVRVNGRPVDGGNEVSLAESTAVFVIGHDVKRDPDTRSAAAELSRGLERTCKRRLESWSPTVHYGLVARGDLEGVLAYRPDEEEQVFCELLLAEAGLEIRRGECWYAAGWTAEVADGLADLARGATP
jgi:myo-inositol-1(or 4)-monophosphatase